MCIRERAQVLGPSVVYYCDGGGRYPVDSACTKHVFAYSPVSLTGRSAAISRASLDRDDSVAERNTHGYALVFLPIRAAEVFASSLVRFRKSGCDCHMGKSCRKAVRTMISDYNM